LPNKILITLALAFLFIIGVYSPAWAEFQVGLESRLQEQQLSIDTVKAAWWLRDNLAVRADYSWNSQDLGLSAVYKINRSENSFYIGLAENDISGKITPKLSFAEKAALIAGMEWELPRIKPGLSLAIEAGINPNEFTGKSGNSAMFSRLGISLNYRFPFPLTGTYKETFDQPTLNLLAKLITLEANNEPLKGQVAVGAVVLNRIRSNKFPASVKDVIYEPGQFSTASMLSKVRPNKSALKAAKMALQGNDPSHGALYFYNPAISSAKNSLYIKKSRFQVTARIGNHVFYK
jgi:hypothetical protein